ncbi:chlorohydrolase family protein [Microbacter sp. GSS18]|nr:chlorohydrolase family protein [Microbacter sp. GSS18]
MTVVRARWVLTHEDGEHRMLENGDVIVAGDQIAEVRPSRGEDVDIDLGDAVLLPGFIDLDALSDIDHAILDSWHSPSDARRLQWSSRHAADPERQHVLTSGERAMMRRYAFAQLLLHGVTTAMPIASEVHSEWAETFEDALQMAQEAQDLGLRVFLGPSYRSAVPVVDDDELHLHWEPRRGEDGLDDAIRFIEWTRQFESPLITGVLLPCRIETLTDEVLVRTGRSANALDTLVRLHCLQGLEELRLLRERGTTPLDLLESAGLLTERLLIPHGIYTDENSRVGSAGGGSVQRIADAGATVVHCPLTSAHYGAALESFDEYRAAGVKIALGTDSFPPDLLRGMDMGSSVAKILAGRLDAGSHRDYLDAATLGGATALRRPDLGRISAGATADLTAVRLGNVRDGIVDDPIRTMIQHSSARAVTMTMVGGEVRVLDGELVGVDMASLQDAAQRIFRKLRAGYGARTAEPSPPDELFPPSYQTAHAE